MYLSYFFDIDTLTFNLPFHQLPSIHVFSEAAVHTCVVPVSYSFPMLCLQQFQHMSPWFLYLRPTEPSGSSQAAAEAEPWIITESLPFGTDVMQTIPLEFGEGLPVEVGLLMQRAGQKTVEEKKSMEEKDRRTTKPIETKHEEPAKAPACFPKYVAVCVLVKCI